jgi:hypothetical protein
MLSKEEYESVMNLINPNRYKMGQMYNLTPEQFENIEKVKQEKELYWKEHPEDRPKEEKHEQIYTK